MLLVADLVDTKNLKMTESLKPWHMGTQLRLLRESFPIYTNLA